MQKGTNLMIKALLYRPEHCPRCRVSKKRMQFYYDEFVIDSNRDKQLLDDFRNRGYSSFPVIQIFDGDIRVDEWCGLQIGKIDHWNQVYAKQKLN